MTDTERMELATDLISDYCMREFDEPADFTDLKKIGIGYTTTEDDRHDIQAYANLIDCRTELWLDGERIGARYSDSLEQFIEEQLRCLDFDELTALPDGYAEKLEQTGRQQYETLWFEAWGKLHEGCLAAGSYSCGGGLAIQLLEKGEDGSLEPFTTVTVNLEEFRLHGQNTAFVDINNFPGVLSLIVNSGLGRLTENVGYSGFCRYPEVAFDLREVRKYCINPEALDERMKKTVERTDAR